jgi:CheY-like chemotaxis protein
MPKIMLVEDDNNLREIYGERLMAEGYEIVSAVDGEQALSLAVKEKPDLVISDVMMPKISGFDMLDILRQTPETQNIRVVMMTALSQTEDKERAEKLGIDKYLVKSQVTLEDVARVVHDILYPVPSTPQQNNEAIEVSNSAVVEEITVTEEPVDNQQAEQPVVETAEITNQNPETSISTQSAETDTSVYKDVQTDTKDESLTDLNSIVNQALSNQPEAPAEEEVVASQTIFAPTEFQPPIVEPSVESSSDVSSPLNTNQIEVVPESDVTIESPAPTFPEPEEVTVSEGLTFPDFDTKQAEPIIEENYTSQEDAIDTPAETVTVAEEVIDEPIPMTPNLEIVDPDDARPETTEQEEAEVNQQINDFVKNTPEADLDNKQQKPFIEPNADTNVDSNPEQNVNTPDPSTIPPISSHNTDSSQQSGSSVPESPSARKKVIVPIHDPSEEKPDINKLFEKEMAEEASNTAIENPNLAHPYSESPQSTPSQPLQTVDINQIDGATNSAEPQFDDNATPHPAPDEDPDSTSTNPNDPTHIAL